MISISPSLSISWRCWKTWKTASYNTFWCLVGCSIGDLGTIAYFQFKQIGLSTTSIMELAIINGLLSSICLETIILLRQMSFIDSVKTACGMSFISMVSMEIAMNLIDVALTGGAKLTLWVVPIMWFFGFITPLPYNYWRLKALGKSCH